MARITFLRIFYSYFFIFLTFGTEASEFPDFTKVVDSASPAVVKIIVEFSGDSRDGFSKDMPDYLRRFFEDRGEPLPKRPQRGSVGSGLSLMKMVM